ncbi:MAG: carboxylating nicotinate-nucleotide diphosphorylase [Verrucomicrobiota bacterium]
MIKRSQDDFSGHLGWESIDLEWVEKLIELAYEEDIQGGGFAVKPARSVDATTQTVISPREGRARLVARHPMSVCGLRLAKYVLRFYGDKLGSVSLVPRTDDGGQVGGGTVLAELHGSTQTIITAERVLLNFLQHLTGIATETARYVAALGSTSTRLLDTRKTTPGYRALEKYAVVCGGGWNHRLGLYDRIMLKDNHLAAAGASTGERLADAVRLAREKRPDLGVEVEVDEIAQIGPVLDAGADVILLDNFSIDELKQAISLIGDKSLTEASGGITLETLPALGQIGLDFISTGATVHQAKWADIGLDWV